MQRCFTNEDASPTAAFKSWSFGNAGIPPETEYVDGMTQDSTGPSAGRENARYVNIAGRKFRVPGSPGGRMAVGTLFVVGGILGFLPILGFWMIPLGLLILSVDLASVRRQRRRMDVWVGRRMNGSRGAGADRDKSGGEG